MKIRLLAVTIVFLTAFGSIHGDESVRTNYSQLKRLQAVLDLPSFPSPSQDSIQTWQQGTASHGKANKFGFSKFPLRGRDEMPLRDIVRFYGGKDMSNDLVNVVIISNNGRSLRFVNFEERDENISVKRGDVVAFLRTEKAK